MHLIADYSKIHFDQDQWHGKIFQDQCGISRQLLQTQQRKITNLNKMDLFLLQDLDLTKNQRHPCANLVKYYLCRIPRFHHETIKSGLC